MQFPELKTLLGRVEFAHQLSPPSDLTRRQFFQWAFIEAAAMLRPSPQESAISWENYWRERKHVPSETRPLYFGETGHHLEGPLLEFWKFHGMGDVIGLPRSEATPAERGVAYQAFENAILKFDSHTGEITPEPLGEKLAPLFGIEPRFTVKHLNPFFYDSAGAEEIFGDPISGVFTLDKLVMLQFYTKGIVFEDWHPPAEKELLYAFQNVQWRHEISPWLLWSGVNYLWADIDAVAPQYGLDLRPVSKSSQAAAYQPDGWEDQYIEVDLAQQRLRHYIGGTLVMDTLVSTGSEGFETPPGEWTIRDKMLTFDFKSPFGARRPYSLPLTPYVMSITSLEHGIQEGWKLHGYYWNRKPGQPGSAGCVSLIPRKARKLWLHARVGARVWIH